MTDGPFGAIRDLTVAGETYRMADLTALEDAGLCELDRLPVSIRVLLESVLRNVDGDMITEEDVRNAASWEPDVPDVEVPFSVSRVILQDLTGVPAVVDLAALRSAAERNDVDPGVVEPEVPCDLVIDHSVQVDYFGSEDAYEKNVEIEYERNAERYRAIKWAQQAFENFNVVPPGTGIVHQVNLEYLGQVVHAREDDSETEWLFPDTLVGTDSHTPMINGIGVVGWGVGGIEAEAAMLGQPITMKLPEVVGVKLTGELPEGATATDLVLHITETLRQVGVVDRFVEFYGPGVSQLSVADRATISNMAPEQGSTISFFPVDEATLDYLELTGRDPEHIDLVKEYLDAQGMYGEQDPAFTEEVEFDLSDVEPSLAGHKKPHARIPMGDLDEHFHTLLDDQGVTPVGSPTGDGGLVSKADHSTEEAISVTLDDGTETEIGHGSILVSAITSCTNTSNPSVMVAAGLLAKNAAEAGLEVPDYVKTSLAPGSQVVTEYLKQAELLEDLESLGYHVVGYGCTTCIGNAGPLPESIEAAIDEYDLWTASVLSGNRNFEARIHPKIRTNYLASPPLVVAYGLAGKIDIDLDHEPIGTGADGEPVYLEEIWPDPAEVKQTIHDNISPAMFEEKYASVYQGDERWDALDAPTGDVYDWDDESTYIREPPFFREFPLETPGVDAVDDARCLLTLGDTVTTDHISPAGLFGADLPAGQWLQEHGVPPHEFNTYGSRRGNHEVMMRGTFANVRIENQLLDGKEGGYTIHHPTDEETTVFEASQRYQADDVPLIVLSGTEFGTGSSRDWAAKGAELLGIRAMIAESYERIFRDNLIGMGVLPLQFQEGDSWESLGLDGSEHYTIRGLDDGVEMNGEYTVVAQSDDGNTIEIPVKAQVGTPAAVRYLENGGILHTVLRRLLTEA